MPNIHVYNKHFHFHLNGVSIPSATLHIHHYKDDDSIKMSWSVCSEKDNFCRRTGADIAKRNMSCGEYVTGVRDHNVPLEVNLFDILETGMINTPHEDSCYSSEYYRKQALQAIAGVHMMKSVAEMMEMYKSDSEEQRPSYHMEDRNWLIDSFMANLPFYTSNIA